MQKKTLKPPFLGMYQKTRNNNFTLFRFILAWLVLFGHSFILTGSGSDPISKILAPHTWLGGIAVGGFFAISGYLVTASITQRSTADFIVSRALRLYPAIIAYSLVAILIIGPLSISVTISQYFNANPWLNLRNSMLWEWTYNLPYVFSKNPVPGSTNGSSWTLPAELRCYLLVLVFGFFGFFEKKHRANLALIGLLFLAKNRYADIPLFGDNTRFEQPLIFFVAGCLFWINRSIIPLSWPLAVILIVSTILSASQPWYIYTYAFSLTYTIFVAVYRLPHIDMDKYGDLSYGIYIYAWPIQQLVWFPGQNAYINVLLATLAILPVSFLSWILIEKPALGLKKYLKSPKPATTVSALPAASRQASDVEAS